MTETAVVAAAVRTPLGRRRGVLAGVRPDELLALTLRELVARAGIEPALIEDVVAGCVNAVGEQGRNIARVAALAAGLPESVAGMTLNRMCGSGQQAVHAAAHAVLSGQQDAVIAGGVESMSRVPMGADAMGVEPPESVTARYELIGQGVAADRIARRWGIGRSELDAFAVRSHARADAAWRSGRYDDETMAIPTDPTAALLGRADPGPGARIVDEGIRPDSTPAALAALAPAFGPDGLHHAGNSSQLTDGAAAVLVCAESVAAATGLRPLGRIRATAVVGVDPTLMLHGVIPVTHRILARAGLTLDDIDLFEVNEAFASVPLAWQRDTGVADDRLNVNGGAIALGHPTGCSGARILTTLLHELRRRGGRYGLQVMCTGGGMATATLVEAAPAETSGGATDG
ncbi:thiolase family protein [Solwaraspora sp. WMMD1047]|uniref:thiolase family protein n=1 Tax=Solwaraspora sp. WMMD1047 TaxID=3016102 RepID=UPI0024159D27|nr:thiolase family protein [Solwaraspora sp. WMMD1047]MDG4834381.1 thiolase family protein [Solwaraspora sp. WMMD1047]